LNRWARGQRGTERTWNSFCYLHELKKHPKPFVAMPHRFKNRCYPLARHDVMQFPDEESIRNDVARDCGDIIDLAKRVLSSWMTVGRSHGYTKSALPPEVINAAYVLDVRACRQFRSVVELCMRGEAHDASILTRTMFENLLALEFVLKPRISLKPYKNRYKSKAPSSMSRLLRARLYLTYFGFQWEVLKSRNSKKARANRRARQLASQVPKQVRDHYESLIGSVWVERFKQHPRTYSGLTVSELAQAIGPVYAIWYNVVYAIQSGDVHASNAAELLHFSEAIWHDMPCRVERTLRAATDMFLAGADSLHKNIGFGSAARMLLSGLDDQYRRIKEKRRNREWQQRDCRDNAS